MQIQDEKTHRITMRCGEEKIDMQIFQYNFKDKSKAFFTE